MATVSRVLPWRRAPTHTSSLVEPVVECYRKHWPRQSAATIRRAFNLANTAHQGARRKTGEAYINHPVAVATVVAELGLDATSICAALLHDAVEDTSLELVDLREQFDEATAAIVDGVTKLDRVRFATKQAQHAATLRKMLVAIAKEPRVLMIKLADRLHNMRTLGVFGVAKQAQVSQETLDIYAPLANRLGMQEVRNELEDLAFAALYPMRYAEIDRLISERKPAQEAYIDQVLAQVRDRLKTMKLDATVTGREKHHWSVYEKMVIKDRSFDEIFDLVGIRLVVPKVSDAYAALGSIHAAWKPVTGRFKDYIAMPKFNLYQSLHTTVVGPEGAILEVQIRTPQMHQRAEYGLAAHWRYKAGDAASNAEIAWLDNVVDFADEAGDPGAFMKALASDLGSGEVYVFTPKGEVVTLPTDSTPIDFAYAIHTDIGDSLIGAKINGRLAPLDRALRSGDTVEAFTSADPNASPGREWLDVVASPKARANIRRFFARSDREHFNATGREEVAEALRAEGLNPTQLLDGDALVAVASQFSRADADLLFEAVGKGDVSAESVARRVVSNLADPTAGQSLAARPAGQRGSGRRRAAAVHVADHDDALVQLAGCCNPQPGDEIMGFTTSGRGVRVHRSNCLSAVELAGTSTARQAEVEWDEGAAGDLLATVEVHALNRDRLLLDVVTVLSGHHLSIDAAETFTGEDQVSVLRFEVALGDRLLLAQLLAALRNVPGVFSARQAPNEVANGEANHEVNSGGAEPESADAGGAREPTEPPAADDAPAEQPTPS